MRAYFLTNMYLSSIQNGIQSLHCLHEMYNKYILAQQSTEFQTLDNWSRNHKTVIVLNGGMSGQDPAHNDLERIEFMFNNRDNIYPWASFREPSIGNALTCVGIVLPETVFNPDDVRRIPKFEQTLFKMLKRKHFAR